MLGILSCMKRVIEFDIINYMAINNNNNKNRNRTS